MTEYSEFEGKNVDLALEKASKELLKPVGELQYDVISYGSTGIFGFVGVRKAKIRVRVDSNGAVLGIQAEAQNKARDLVAEAFEDVPLRTSNVAFPEEEEEEEVAVLADTTDLADDLTDSADNTDLTELAAVGAEALRRVVESICEGANIEIVQRKGRIVYNVEGGNSALLIGKRGQTLEAIQYIIEKIVNRQNSMRVRVLVDVEGYLGARKTNLQKLAAKMAEKAQRLGKPVTIGQMNAYDRRIVHLHLKDNAAVRTQSVGEGYYRKLVIFPKRRRRAKAKPE
jgi:spoIIIJ-associated protein